VLKTYLNDWAVKPKGNINGEQSAKNLDAKNDRFRIDSSENRKNDVVIIVVSEKANAHK
jgi:hypothetical protein